MYIYSYTHTRKRLFTKRPMCFPFPWCDAPCTSSGTEEWAGRRAEDKQQDSCSKFGPDSMCWIVWGKGSRGYKAGSAGDGGDRGQVGGPCSVREPSDCKGRDRADPTGLARTDMEDLTPSRFLKGLPFAVCVVHPVWNMSVPQPSWDRNTRWTWSTGRLPKWTPETPSGWKYFISSIQRQSANFSPTEKKDSALSDNLYTMNNSSSPNKQLKPENPEGAHFARFLVLGLQYKLTYIQCDKCHSVSFNLITPNLC